jgi:hypothetical protein
MNAMHTVELHQSESLSCSSLDDKDELVRVLQRLNCKPTNSWLCLSIARDQLLTVKQQIGIPNSIAQYTNYLNRHVQQVPLIEYSLKQCLSST